MHCSRGDVSIRRTGSTKTEDAAYLVAAALGADGLLESVMTPLMLETEFLFEREPPLSTVFMRFIYFEMPSSLEAEGMSDIVRSETRRDETTLLNCNGATLVWRDKGLSSQRTQPRLKRQDAGWRGSQ